MGAVNVVDGIILLNVIWGALYEYIVAKRNISNARANVVVISMLFIWAYVYLSILSGREIAEVLQRIGQLFLIIMVVGMLPKTASGKESLLKRSVNGVRSMAMDEKLIAVILTIMSILINSIFIGVVL